MIRTISLAGLLCLMAGITFAQVAKAPDTGIDPKTPAVTASRVAKGAETTEGRTATVSPKPLTVVSGPGSMSSVILDESFDVYSVARIAPDGKIVYDCVTGKNAAAVQVKTPVQKKEQLDEK